MFAAQLLVNYTSQIKVQNSHPTAATGISGILFGITANSLHYCT